jgi:molybdopterin synthase catalytic subunit
MTAATDPVAAAPRLVTVAPDLASCVRLVSRPGAGAVATFLGTVRDENEGLPVTLLEYHAYESMAEKEIRAIEAEISAEVEGVRVVAVHRLGALEVGDVAVACAASAPHRGEAFRAVRLLIDRLKERVPIWKREHGPAGPHWVGWRDARCSADDHDHAAHGHARGPASSAPER